MFSTSQSHSQREWAFTSVSHSKRITLSLCFGLQLIEATPAEMLHTIPSKPIH